MYEPVSDRCLTAPVIKCPIGDGAINGLTERKDLSPPEKPPRRYNRTQRQLARRASYEGVTNATPVQVSGEILAGDPHCTSLETSAETLSSYSRCTSPVAAGAVNNMRADSNDACINIDHLNLENNYKNRLVEASVQTTQLVPYRLRFWPGNNCDVKLSPSETNCGLKAKCCCRILSQWILSQVGLTIVVTMWALLGAFAFFNTEGPREQEQSSTLAKIQKDLSNELAKDLKATMDRQEEWPSTIHKYFEKHESLFLEAVGAGFGEGGGGNIWTYPGCILFAVSLLTTLGFGAPVPRTSLGRGSAVLFASIGIPLHFLLILNIGNLAAMKLQKFALRNLPTDIPTSPRPRWLKLFPFLSILLYYLLGVSLFGFARSRDPVSCFMFPLDFTAAGGVATVEGQVRIFYALYLEIAVTLAAIVVSLLQASASRGIVDIGLKLGLLTNT